MHLIKTTILVFVLTFFSQGSFADSLDDSNSSSGLASKINSSSFSYFVSSMDNLGFDNIYFKRAPDEYKASIEEKFLDASKTNDVNEIYKFFQYELNENPQYAYKIYNEALLHLYDLSPQTFNKNSLLLKKSLIEIIGMPDNHESNITYTNELDCGDEEYYEPCKKLYQNKMRVPFMLLLILAGIW